MIPEKALLIIENEEQTDSVDLRPLSPSTQKQLKE